MPKFITITDENGIEFTVNSDRVVVLYPRPKNPSTTMVECADGFKLVSTESVAALVGRLTEAPPTSPSMEAAAE